MAIVADNDRTSATLHIQSVARLTNLSVDTIRAWEKRYAAVVPSRAPAGQRRFSSDDVARLILLKQAVDAGEAISSVAPLSTSTLRSLVQNGRKVGDADDAIISDLLHSVRVMDAGELASKLTLAALSRSAIEFADDIIAPLMVEIETNAGSWTQSTTYALLLSISIHSVSSVLFEKYRASNSRPLILFLTLPGEKHSLPPMLAALAAAEAGYRILYVGTEVAPYHVESMLKSLRAAALGIYIGAQNDETNRPLQELRKRIEVPLFLGAASARRYAKLGATESLRDFVAALNRTPLNVTVVNRFE